MKDEIAARLSAIRERERAATPGPWYTRPVETGVIRPNMRRLWVDPAVPVELDRHQDATFIAAARTDVRWLLDVAEAAAAFLAAWEDDPTGGMADTCDGAAALIEAFKGARQ